MEEKTRGSFGGAPAVLPAGSTAHFTTCRSLKSGGAIFAASVQQKGGVPTPMAVEGIEKEPPIP